MPIKHVALPLTVEDAFYPAGLVAAVLVHFSPTGGRPTHNLDVDIIGMIDETTITLNRVVSRLNQGSLVQWQGGLVGRSKKILRGVCDHRFSACVHAGANVHLSAPEQTAVLQGT